MEDLKKNVDNFTTQLERALEEIYAAILERQEKTKYIDFIQQSQQVQDKVNQVVSEEAEFNRVLAETQKMKDERLGPDKAAEDQFTIMNKRQDQFKYNRTLDFDPIASIFENDEQNDIFIFIRMLPNILKTELEKNAAVLKELLTKDEFEYVHSLDIGDYDGRDPRILEILDKMLPKRKEISDLLDKFTDVIRSKCGNDCSKQSIPTIISTSTELGGTKSRRTKKSNRKTRKRVK